MPHPARTRPPPRGGTSGARLAGRRDRPPLRHGALAVARVHDAGPPRPADDRDRAAVDLHRLARRLPAQDARLDLGRLLALPLAARRPRAAAPAQLGRHRDRRRPGRSSTATAATASTSGRCGSCSGASARSSSPSRSTSSTTGSTAWTSPAGARATRCSTWGRRSCWPARSAAGGCTPRPGRIRDLVSLGLWLFFVENALFPNQHQEYGVLSLRAYDAGQTTAEPQLLDFAAAQGQSPAMFMLPVPSWVHPAWLICAGLLSLVVARKMVGLRWTATIIAARVPGLPGGHVAGCLVGMGFPPSVLPLVLLVGAVLVDLRVTYRVPGWLAGLAGHRRRLRRRGRPGGPRPAAAVELVVGAAGRGRLRPAVGRRWTCSTAAPGWPAGGRRGARARGRASRPDPRHTGAGSRGRPAR